MVTLRASRHTPRMPTHAPPHTNPLMIPDVSFDVCVCAFDFPSVYFTFRRISPQVGPVAIKKSYRFLYVAPTGRGRERVSVDKRDFGICYKKRGILSGM